MKTWAYIGSNEVRMNNMDLISAVFAIVANLTNLTNVPITSGNARNAAPAVEQVVTFDAAGDAAGIIAYRSELKAIAAKHDLIFFPI